MNKKILLIVCVALPLVIWSQKALKILGSCSTQDLEQEPYAAWYSVNYKAYEPDKGQCNQLSKLNLKKYTIKAFFGSWCGDSKREVPRFTKVLDAIDFPKGNLQLIGVEDSMRFYKQSPGHEEKGLNIYKVPTFVVYEKGKEVGRIVEYPALSLERDLQKIFSHQSYTPNYLSYPLINGWLETGTLTDPNVNVRGLAGQLKKCVGYESELNSCGYVLMMRGQVNEAITVLKVNVSLFPQSANCLDSLGEAYALAGQNDKAIQAYEAAQKLAPDNENIKKRLQRLKEAS